MEGGRGGAGGGSGGGAWQQQQRSDVMVDDLLAEGELSLIGVAERNEMKVREYGVRAYTEQGKGKKAHFGRK